MDKLSNKIDEIKEEQTKILVQTTKTNGRVTALETVNSNKKTDNRYIITTFIAGAALLITLVKTFMG
jgi:hypothetical protein